jgi:hypothetical protein
MLGAQTTSRTEVDMYDFVINVPDIEEVRDITNKNLSKAGYFLLVVVLRAYLLSLNFLKQKYLLLKQKINEIKQQRRLKKGIEITETREENKFLQKISEYKAKIRKIKKKIKEEEGLN